MIGHEDNIVYSSLTQDLRYEAELCFVIRREAKNVPEGEALDYVLGYACGNDLTAVDLSQKDGRPIRFKSLDTSGSLGPFLVTGLDPRNLAIKGRVNGETKQSSNFHDPASRECHLGRGHPREGYARLR